MIFEREDNGYIPLCEHLINPRKTIGGVSQVCREMSDAIIFCDIYTCDIYTLYITDWEQSNFQLFTIIKISCFNDDF